MPGNLVVTTLHLVLLPECKVKDLSLVPFYVSSGALVQVSMKLEMKDSPGQLVSALQPISEVGGNIIAVIHQRDLSSREDTLGVQIVLEIAESRLTDLVSMIKARGVNILRIGKDRLLYKQTVIMIGHLMHTDLSDTVDRIDCTGFAEVTALDLAMPAINEPSSARLIIKSVSKQDMDSALDILREVAKAKKLLIIEPLEGELV
jgi:ACT domain-containing protein